MRTGPLYIDADDYKKCWQCVIMMFSNQMDDYIGKEYELI